MQFHK